MDDISLLRRYVDHRSESAFAEIVRRHIDLVYFAAWRQTGGNSGLAQEVAQIVFTDLARKAPALVHRPVLTGWLHTSVRYAAANARRSEQRRRVREQEASAMQEANTPAESARDWQRLRPVLDDALHTLADDDRTAVLLRFFEARPFAEIAAVLRVSEEAARKRVQRALEKMAAALSRHGLASTAAALAWLLETHAHETAPRDVAAAVTSAAIAAAGAGAKTAAVAGAVAAMLTSTKAILAGAALAAMSTGFALNATRAERAGRTELALIRRQNHALEEKVAAANQRAHAAAERMHAADADAAQLLKAVQEAAPRFAFPAGDAVAVALVVDTSGSMRDPARGALWPVVSQAVRDAIAAHPDAEYLMLLDADGRFMMPDRPGWLPVRADTLAQVDGVLKTYARDTISSPVPGIYRAMRELPPPGRNGARLHVCVIGDEFVENEDPVLRRLAELNAANASGQRRATISAIQLPTTIRYTGGMGNTGLKFQALLREVARQHAGTFTLLPPQVLQR